MPRSKTGEKRERIVKDNIENAVAAVASSDMSMRQACAVFSVKLGTLHRHVQAYKHSQTVKFEYKANNAVKQVFNMELEQHLLKYIKQAARIHYGMSKLDVHKLSYQYALASKLTYLHQWDKNKFAGGEWMRAFLKNNGEHISLQKPESTSVAQSTSFNKLNVQQFLIT
jgi:hypothetical protein